MQTSKRAVYTRRVQGGWQFSINIRPTVGLLVYAYSGFHSAQSAHAARSLTLICPFNQLAPFGSIDAVLPVHVAFFIRAFSLLQREITRSIHERGVSRTFFYAA
ncbi:hypothetical protein PISMIDRAFT_12641 [Pisolithus microcarpus 441]|uniref:Uncharacterized protein n=1 Tax=Pisolithus microcarpus 441 TaxID=765257 RepID=A0A0C9ZLY7_9AGAM|nr:hypothetical protein PISMIDRAFT_12641 [Pisolithus microcarpus 441]